MDSQRQLGSIERKNHEAMQYCRGVERRSNYKATDAA